MHRSRGASQHISCHVDIVEGGIAYQKDIGVVKKTLWKQRELETIHVILGKSTLAYMIITTRNYPNHFLLLPDELSEYKTNRPSYNHQARTH
jgi:hypothetical protein